MKAPAVLAASILAGALLAGLPSACGSSTGGRRIALEVRVEGSPAATAPFTNAAGWNITISKALLSIGPLYYYDGATIFSEHAPQGDSLPERLWRALGERTALAHPGHYVPGTARGQYLASSSADLRTASLLGSGDGISGTVRSATFSFATPASGPFARELAAHVAVVEGRATKDGAARVFRAEIDAADVLNAEGAPDVDGCPFVEADMQSDGVVTLTVDVGEWFAEVEFDEVPASSDGAPVPFPAGSIGKNELVRGMKESLPYRFSYAPD